MSGLPRCAHCCGGTDPHCPHCHMVAVHGQPVWLMVFDVRGRKVFSGTDQDDAFAAARMVGGVLVALPIVADYRGRIEDQADTPDLEGSTVDVQPALSLVGGPLPKRHTAASVDAARRAMRGRQERPGAPETDGYALGRGADRHAGPGGDWGYAREDT